ncbi:MAG: D-alanyl-D-alanine carboxypeptidase family protein [Pseudomonadota bacterium]
MRRPWLWASALALLLLAAMPAEARRYASIVIDAQTGAVLHEEQADRWVYPASLTKMMTLYMAFEAIEDGRLRLDQELPVSRAAAAKPPSKLGLRTGQTISVRNTMLALVTRSANDAAVVLGEAIGGTESGFGRMMTKRARALGLRSTTFRNASGLPNTEQRTTARDMARLGLRLQRDFPQYYGYFSTRKFAYGGRTYGNHNRLLGNYRGTDGIKTGYIRASGFNLVASVERDGRRLIGVVIGGRTAKSRNAHMVELLDAAFTEAGRRPVVFAVGPSPLRPRIAAAASAAGGMVVADLSPGAGEARGPGLLMPTLRPDAQDPVRAASATNAPAPGQISPLRVVIAPQISGEGDQVGATTRSKAAVPPRQPATSVATLAAGRNFGIQIGAFNSATAAHRAAEGIVAHASDALAGSSLEVSAVDRNGATLYRARRMGLGENIARQVCDRLLSSGRPCLVVFREGLQVQTLSDG